MEMLTLFKTQDPESHVDLFRSNKGVPPLRVHFNASSFYSTDHQTFLNPDQGCTVMGPYIYITAGIAKCLHMK